MRLTFSVLFIILSIALCICALIAANSKKALGRTVALLDAAFIPPVIGNLLIVGTSTESLAKLGCYIYFLGMDLVMLALSRFTAEYCQSNTIRIQIPKFIYLLLGVDTVQLLLNPFFGHAFTNEAIIVDNAAYYRFIPHLGQTFHRIVDYSILGAVIIIFLIKVIKTSRIYRGRYSIILLTLIVGALWQTFYIFSRTPIDRSMIGFAFFGIMIFYFSLYYRPLRLLDRMLSDIVSDMSESLFVFDPNGKCIWINEQGCLLAEVENGNYDDVTQKLTEMFGAFDSEKWNENTMQMIGAGEDMRYYILEESQVIDNKEKLTGFYLRIRDITEEQRRRKRELYDATHDRLTGLYTREYLYSRILEEIRNHPELDYLVVFVDVKNFKIVNDIFGTAFGDHALRSIADWIRNDLSDRCCFGRLAGDTFGILSPQKDFCAEKIEAALSGFKVQTKNTEYHLLIHLGVYHVNRGETDVSVMFDRAHLALSMIQDEYHTHIAYYDDEIRSQLLWDQTISAQLRDAIEARELRPYLQPIADPNGKIVGAEALVRWLHNDLGFLAPFKFIPVFEKNGMIVEVDQYMWRCACEILKKWQEKGLDLFISVNISPKDFYFTDVGAEIMQLAEEFGIDNSKLRIEITETVMMNDADGRMQVLESLRNAGFIVEMDDFGSGFSSLNMLKDMPVDVLKIDMKFLGKTKDGNKASKIVRNIINLAEDLDIAALTEGVETVEQFESLAEMGCKLFQGYYFSKPLPLADFEEFAGIE